MSTAFWSIFSQCMLLQSITFSFYQNDYNLSLLRDQKRQAKACILQPYTDYGELFFYYILWVYNHLKLKSYWKCMFT